MTPRTLLTLKILGYVLATLLVFKVGEVVGIKKASYSYNMGDHFFRAFRDTDDESSITRDRDIPGGHDALGRVVRISLPTLTVLDRKDNIEKTITISSTTDIKRAQNDITPSELAVDNEVLVLGTPQADGTIDAKFIRLLPRAPLKDKVKAKTDK